jgi:hypothetical protein
MFQLELYSQSPSSWRKRLEGDARVMAQYRRLFGDPPSENKRQRSKKKEKHKERRTSAVAQPDGAVAASASTTDLQSGKHEGTGESAGHLKAGRGSHALGRGGGSEGGHKGSARSVADDVMAVLGINSKVVVSGDARQKRKKSKRSEDGMAVLGDHNSAIAGSALQSKEKNKKDEGGKKGNKRHKHNHESAESISLASVHDKSKFETDDGLQVQLSGLSTVEGKGTQKSKKRKMRELKEKHD